MSDNDIINLYFARDEMAITETSQKYGAYCGTIAYQILLNNEDREECLNDTWLHTWNAIPPKRPSLLRTFLGKITRNLALNRYEKATAAKRGGGETPAVLEELSEIIAGPTHQNPDQIPDMLTLTDTINRFLETLKPEQRKIFVRRYWYLSDIREIATDYALSESKVKMTLQRARQGLLQKLTEEGITL